LTHVMVDIETFDTTPQAAIASIGACNFDENGIGAHVFYTTVNLQSCVDVGMTLGTDTIKWWLGQSDAARSALTSPATMPLRHALEELSAWWPDKATFWGNGATFDNVIMSEAYRLTKIERPWRYTADRCYRTMKAEFPQIMADNRGGTHHNALDDAIYQAAHMAKILKHIKGL